MCEVARWRGNDQDGLANHIYVSVIFTVPLIIGINIMNHMVKSDDFIPRSMIAPVVATAPYHYYCLPT